MHSPFLSSTTNHLSPKCNKNHHSSPFFFIPVIPSSIQDPQDLPGDECFALETTSESMSTAHTEPKKKPHKEKPWDQPKTFSQINYFTATHRECTSVFHHHVSLPSPPISFKEQSFNTQMDFLQDLDRMRWAYVSEGYVDVTLTTRCIVCNFLTSGFLYVDKACPQLETDSIGTEPSSLSIHSIFESPSLFYSHGAAKFLSTQSDQSKSYHLCLCTLRVLL